MHRRAMRFLAAAALAAAIVVPAVLAATIDDDVDNLGGQYRVQLSAGDKDAFSWNRDTAILAPTHVALKGYLPAAKVTADRPTGRTS